MQQQQGLKKDVNGFLQQKEDHFDSFFRIFSTKHSWYKGVRYNKSGERDYYFVPEHDGTWTMTIVYNVLNDVPKPYHRFVFQHLARLNDGMLCAHDHQRGLFIALNDGGMEFAETLAKRQYPSAIALVKTYKQYSVESFYSLPSNVQLQICITPNLDWSQMISSEYERMRSMAKQVWFQFMNTLYEHLRNNHLLLSRTQTSYGCLQMFITTYQQHHECIHNVLKHILPDAIILHSLLPFHHIYD